MWREEVALRLRGREVLDAESVWSEMVLQRQREEEASEEIGAVSEAVFEQASAALRRYVTGLDLEVGTRPPSEAVQKWVLGRVGYGRAPGKWGGEGEGQQRGAGERWAGCGRGGAG